MTAPECPHCHLPIESGACHIALGGPHAGQALHEECSYCCGALCRHAEADRARLLARIANLEAQRGLITCAWCHWTTKQGIEAMAEHMPECSARLDAQEQQLRLYEARLADLEADRSRLLDVAAMLGCTSEEVVKKVDAALSERDAAQLAFEGLKATIDVPEVRDFLVAVERGAAHQRVRWGSEHDEGKTAADWFWLLGWLGGKAVHAQARADEAEHCAGMTPEHVQAHRDKALHHIITTAAACANWHAQLLGKSDMRPGIEKPKGEAP